MGHLCLQTCRCSSVWWPTLIFSSISHFKSRTFTPLWETQEPLQASVPKHQIEKDTSMDIFTVLVISVITNYSRDLVRAVEGFNFNPSAALTTPVETPKSTSQDRFSREESTEVGRILDFCHIM